MMTYFHLDNLIFQPSKMKTLICLKEHFLAIFADILDPEPKAASTKFKSLLKIFFILVRTSLYLFLEAIS